jgi:hypothetical protein
MFEKTVDDRLSAWAQHRLSLENIEDPLTEVWEFWQQAPFIPYNKNIDPFNQRSWPTPWEIIVYNKYDDFTKALMIAWSLKLTKRFQNGHIEIKTLVNDRKTCYYNIVCVEDQWVLNYNDNGPIDIKNLPDSFLLENLIEVKSPR